MAWGEVEEDLGDWGLPIGLVAVAAGAAVWWCSNFTRGFFAYLGVMFGGFVTRELWLQIQLPWEARRAANFVLAWFRDRHPDVRVQSVTVRAVEPERYVIAIRHGLAEPTPRRYFAIARPGLATITELPTEDWWPRGLK